MDTPSTGVETIASTAPEKPEELKTTVPAVPPELTDTEKAFLALEQRAKKAEADRDNYKTALLVKKGKIPAEEIQTGEESIDEIVERKVRENIMNLESEKIRQEREELIQKTLRENRELKLAVQNRSQISNFSQGTSQDKPEGKSNNLWSDEQLAYFKERNLDPEEVRKNLPR